MVLTFSDWSNYVDETGSPRTIDWDNLPGTPHVAAVEALRQALFERIGRVADLPTYWADLDRRYAGGALLQSPLVSGVDMDARRKMRAMEIALRDAASMYRIEDGGGFGGGGRDVWSAAAFVRHDAEAAAWAREMKRVLSACTVTLAYGGSTVAGVVPEPPRAAWFPGGVVPTIGSISIDEILVTERYWADVLAAFAVRPWTPSTSSSTAAQAQYYVYYGTVPGYSYGFHAFRRRLRLSLGASDLARTLRVYLQYGGQFPEGNAEGMVLETTVGPTMDAVEHVVRDSRQMPDTNPLTGTNVYTSAAAQLWIGMIAQDWAVPGGFTFQE